MKFMNKEFFRFLIVGGINTVTTYIIYALFLLFLEYNFAYIISYVSGIIVSFILNGKFVFKVHLTLEKAIKFPLVYVVQYMINFLVLNFLIKQLAIHELIAPVIVIIISIPITFILSKVILKK
ncbi:GtrA family protein [Lysinibacillus sp. KU-BSD001]|uniref:GtrA family protein n=1 Tax=Lysinibacillus sp. KU-BSD001 TaxID=3141328 RepID=UPI0036E5F018